MLLGWVPRHLQAVTCGGDHPQVTWGIGRGGSLHGQLVGLGRQDECIKAIRCLCCAWRNQWLHYSGHNMRESEYSSVYKEK